MWNSPIIFTRMRDLVQSVSPAALSWAVVAVYIGTFFWLKSRSSKQRLPLPPGPRGLPLIGNSLQTPAVNPWEKYKEWSDEFGPVMTLSLGSTTTIILSSHQVANDLMEKKSTIYSSRPQLVMFNRLSGGMNSSGMEYGKRWRDHRSLQAAVLRPWMTQRYTALRDVETKQLLAELLKTDDFSSCFKRMVASLFMTLAYGRRVQYPDDPEIQGMEELVRVKSEAGETFFRATGQLVEYIPLLQYLPSFLTPWKEMCDRICEQFNMTFVDRLREGISAPAWTWAKEVSKHKVARPMSELEVSYTLGTLYEASLTSQQILRIIVLVAALYPEKAAKAQEELDKVVGANRLPAAADARNLPYIDAFVKEALRWRPFAPLGAPRESIRDVEYNGYFIPKGATVLVNQWALDYNEDVFPEPFSFLPERWIANPDLPFSTFGFGQRGCPGRYFAQDSLFISTARLLWAFNIRTASPVEVEDMLRNPSAGAFLSPIPEFDATFTARDAQRKALIEKEWEIAPKESYAILREVEKELTSEA